MVYLHLGGNRGRFDVVNPLILPLIALCFPGRLLVIFSFSIYTIDGFLGWYGIPRPFFLIPLGFEHWYYLIFSMGGYYNHHNS